MRINTFARKLVGLASIVVTGFRFESYGLVLTVRPRWRAPRCGCCRQRAPAYDHRPTRSWSHLPLGALRLMLEYTPRRASCPRCGVRVEQVPWARQGSRFTEAFEEMAAYQAQNTNQTVVAKLLGLSWATVGNIVERVVSEKLDPSRLDGLRFIGVDEFSYRKRHRYLTIVVDHVQRRAVWAQKGKDAEALNAFFDELGPERAAKIEVATIDMSGAFIKSVRANIPQAMVAFDRFHVQRLVTDAVDEVRRSLVRQTKGTDAGSFIKGSRFALLKNPWNLTCIQQAQLMEIRHSNRQLYRAYHLKEELAGALDDPSPRSAEVRLDAWLAWASRSRLAPMVKAARTIRKYKAGVLAYISTRLTNGLAEGINNKLRTVARRAFGFHTAEALSAMLYLCCGGIQLTPPLPPPLLPT